MAKNTRLTADSARGRTALAGPAGNLLEINAVAEVGDKGVFTLNVRGTPVGYDAAKGVLSCGDVSAPLAPEGSMVRLRILLDRGSIEVFGNDGRVAISRAFAAENEKPGLSLAVPVGEPSGDVPVDSGSRAGLGLEISRNEPRPGRVREPLCKPERDAGHYTHTCTFRCSSPSRSAWR